jgi:integrase
MGRGHIRRRGKRWAAVIELPRDPATNRRRQRWISAPTRREAERKQTEALSAADQGTLVEPNRLTVGVFLRQWLRDYAATNVREKTRAGYESIINRRFVPTIGALRLSQLEARHLQTLYADMLASGRLNAEGGVSARTVTNAHRVVSEALSYAVKWELVARNVALTVDPPRPVAKEMHFLDSAGIQRLLDAARDADHAFLPLPLVHLAVFTGLRRSEILALRWGDVDLDLARLHIVRSLHVAKGGRIIFEEPKTTKGRRMVSLSPAAVLELRAHRERQQRRAQALGTERTVDAPVFCRADGSPLLPDTVTHVFARMVKKADLGTIRFHDLRHSHASLMLRQGVHPKVLQERLGHSTISVTLDTYSHVTPGLQEAAALRFEEGLENIAAPSPGQEPANVPR